jgi:U3 small nucleolar RNA-associated protein 12
MLSVLGSDGKLEFFSVLLDQKLILKKMVRLEKR